MQKMSKKSDSEMAEVKQLILKLDDRLDSVDKTLVKQEANLSEHMRRTALLEDEIKPLKKHVWMFEGGLKLLGIISLVGGLVGGLLRLFGLI